MAEILLWVLAVVVLLSVLIGLIRLYVRGGVCHCTAQLFGKTVIVTGANTGIGKETARDLASRGARVILACRNLDAATAAAEDIRRSHSAGSVVVMHLDLADMRSVQTFAQAVLENESRLDILINNAGIMRCPKWRTAQGFEMQYGVNHLGHFLLTNLLADLLRKTGTKDNPSRVINVSSIGHKRARLDFSDLNLEKQPDSEYNPRQVYCNSKIMNILFTLELSLRFRATKDCHVVTSSLHPGIIRTELARHMFKDVNRLLYLFLVPVAYLALKSPTEGAQTSIYLAVKPNPREDDGKYFADCKETPCTAAAKDKTDAARLWLVSEEACKPYLQPTFTLNAAQSSM
ncbi:MAG: SDR family NAD(P)-dependent oxidoreductase [Bacteroidota bacterium]